MSRPVRTLLPLVGSLVALSAYAQDAAPVAAAVEAPTVDIVGAAPVGPGIARDKSPVASQRVGSEAIAKTGSTNLGAALERTLSSVSLNDVSGNPFLADLSYRGFVASSVPGTPQGLAVYQNGVRLNAPFGDTVHWDLLPTVAIDEAEILPSSPQYGLNALGGALSLTMKNGFSWQGAESDTRFGSRGRAQQTLQYGKQAGAFSAYLAGETLSDDGFRQHGGSRVRRVYGDLGWRDDASELHLNGGAAWTRFGASAAVPVEMLSRTWSAIYTSPQSINNQAANVSITGSHKFLETWRLDGTLYARSLREAHVDGNAFDVERCSSRTTNALYPYLCQENDPFPASVRSTKAGFILHDPTGAQIPFAVLGGGQAGTIDKNWTFSRSWGGTAQLGQDGPLFGHGNKLLLGVALDWARADYRAGNYLGVIQPDLTIADLGLPYSDTVAGGVAPVRLKTEQNTVGLYLVDAFDITPAWTVSGGGRFNYASLKLNDQLGTALNGKHSFNRFNPMIGSTYKLTSWATGFVSYAETNRTPTPLELSCADPAHPCMIDNFLVADPPLKQVVTRSVEGGLRGSWRNEDWGGRLGWSASLFRAENQNDIVSVPSITTGRGYFVNAGRTVRQGVEAELTWRSPKWMSALRYSFVDATFADALTLSSPNHPAADANGAIAVPAGRQIPGNPRHRVKLSSDYTLGDGVSIGGDIQWTSEQYLRGDEANLLPRLKSYATVNLRTAWEPVTGVTLYGLIENLFDRRYRSFGTLFETGQIASLGLSDPRSVTPGAPFGVYGGVRLNF